MKIELSRGEYDLIRYVVENILHEDDLPFEFGIEDDELLDKLDTIDGGNV